MQEQPRFVPSQFADGAKLLALNEHQTMEKIQEIYKQEDFKSVIFGLYDSYDAFINDEEADKLLVELEVQAKLMCLRFKKV